MNTVLSLAAFTGLSAAAMGYGLAVLNASGTSRYLESGAERLAIAFVIGAGVIGWLLFFPGVAGVFGAALFWAVIAAGIVLCVVCRRSAGDMRIGDAFSTPEILILAVLAIAAGFDLLEALSPAADADSLAYHFALPRDFIAAGRIEFVPRAVSGAIPLLYHMTYAAALGTGGELALTLWTMATGWATGLLLYALSRRYLDRVWSLALLALFVTTPAVLYGGGSGQIEIRCAGAALAAAILIVTAERENALRVFAVAGICAGFFMAGKYFGLIFAGSAGLVVLCRRRRGLRYALIFGSGAALAGFQWYFWNWLHTGDPVFPTLTNLLQFPDSRIWTRDFGAYFTGFLVGSELSLDRSLLNWIVYPVLSVFDMVPRLEGGRTGLGITLFVILPVALWGLAGGGDKRRDYLLLLAIALIFYTTWFFSGTTQRTRHQLPVYPLLLLGLYPAAVAAARRLRVILPLATGVGAIIAVQLGGQTLFAVNSIRYAFGSETRSAYLYRNVPGANAAEWINRNLPPGAKIGFLNRQLAFLITRPSFMLHPHIQVAVDVRPTAGDENRFVTEMQRYGITHILVAGDWSEPETARIRNAPFYDMLGRLIEAGCLQRIKRFDTVNMPSRTLSQFGGTLVQTEDWILALVPDRCPKSADDSSAAKKSPESRRQ